MKKRIAALLMVVGFMLVMAAPVFADKPSDKPFWRCTFEGVTFTATPKAAQEINREQGRGTCELVHPTQ
jgi:hypothetical protein